MNDAVMAKTAFNARPWVADRADRWTHPTAEAAPVPVVTPVPLPASGDGKVDLM